jgi:thiamine pyrophosphokinase
LSGLAGVRAFIGDTEFVLVHGGHKAQLDTEEGQAFSVVALHGPCTGVSITGARWELLDAMVTPTEARGLSNEAKEHTMVSVETGVITVVIP